MSYWAAVNTTLPQISVDYTRGIIYDGGQNWSVTGTAISDRIEVTVVSCDAPQGLCLHTYDQFKDFLGYKYNL